jgi:hypothetical protein
MSFVGVMLIVAMEPLNVRTNATTIEGKLQLVGMRIMGGTQ